MWPDLPCITWIFRRKSVPLVTALSSCACALSWETPSSWTISGLRRGSGASGWSQCGKKAAAFQDGWYRRRWCNGGCRGSARPRVLNTYAPAWFSRITCVSPWFDVFAIKVQAVLMPYNTSNIGEWGSCLEYSGICATGIFAVFKKRRTEWKKRKKIKRKISRTKRGIYFRVDSVDKVDRGLSVHKLSSASAYNTIIYLFSLIKRYNYRYALICQHLAMDFLISPNLSTLVNVCQRILFHGCYWYNETYRLSTLSTLKCVHIIFRNVFNKKGHLYDDLLMYALCVTHSKVVDFASFSQIP